MNCSSLMEDGLGFLKNKQYNNAEAAYQNVISFHEKETEDPERNQILCEAYNNLGYTFYKRVEFTKAVECYNKSIMMNTSYGVAYYNRGMIYYRLGVYESAVKDLENAVFFEPDNLEFKTGLEECKYALKLKSM